MTAATPEPLIRALFADLADGEFHSGEQLALQHQVTRGGIWKAVGNLRLLGLPIEAVPNRGYRLAAGVTPLAVDAILSAVAPQNRRRVASCTVLWSADSTNSTLLETPAARCGDFHILLAENQLAGRGRRGRSWLAPLGSGLCLSIGFGVDTLPRDFGGLTLAVGVAVRAAATAGGAHGLAIKWPNDLVCGQQKLGGILTELRAEAGGPAWVVVGIGLNFLLPADAVQSLASAGAPPGDLRSLGLTDDRNQLAARIIDHCIAAIDLFLAEGLAPFQTPWREHDALCGKPVRVAAAGNDFAGQACGIDASGALVVSTPSGPVTVMAGDVSVRAGREAV